MKRNFVVISTKGGTGKSIISTMVIPAFFAGQNRQITVYSVDDNNTIEIKSDYINFKNLRVKDSEDVVDEVEIMGMEENDDISIIDSGGGADSLSLLKTIKKTDVKGLAYIIPIADDIEQVYNLENTMNAIKDASPDAEIYLILNKVNEMTKDGIKEQFVGIYGSEKYMIEPIVENILDSVNGVYFLESSPIFSIIKNIHQTSMLDAYLDADALLDNLDEKKREWVKKGRGFYKAQNSKLRFAKDVISLTKRVHEMKTMVGGK